jgi:hypothetical protein
VGSLYSIGRSSGFVWNFSETSNEIVCVEDGFLDQEHIVKAPINLYQTMLTQKGNFRIQDLREHWIKQEHKSFPRVTLPDGQEFTFESDLLSDCTNLLASFMNGRKEGGLDMLCTGGVFGFSGFREQIYERAQKYVNVNRLYLDQEKGYQQAEFYRYSGFIGASILGSLSGYSEFFLSREDYLEIGRGSLVNERETDLDMIDEEKQKVTDVRHKFKIVDKMFQ